MYIINRVCKCHAANNCSVLLWQSSSCENPTQISLIKASMPLNDVVSVFDHQNRRLHHYMPGDWSYDVHHVKGNASILQEESPGRCKARGPVSKETGPSPPRVTLTARVQGSLGTFRSKNLPVGLPFSLDQWHACTAEFHSTIFATLSQTFRGILLKSQFITCTLDFVHCTCTRRTVPE